MPALSSQELSANYGWALATINAVPDLKKLFQRAVAKQYTPERFVAEMRATKWFQSTSESQRKYLVLKTADPAQYVAQSKAVMTSLQSQYASMTGEVLAFTPPRLGPNGTVIEGTGFLAGAASHSMMFGWNAQQIQANLASAVNWKQKIANDSLGGSASGSLQQMRQNASALGIQPTEDWLAQRTQQIAAGNDTLDSANQGLKNMAKQRYSAFADQIESGASMQQISDGYRQSMAKILEVPPTSVDVFDPKIQSALMKTDEGGKNVPQTIHSFEQDLRNDPRWEYTQNARDTMSATGMNTLRSFGLAS